MMAFCIFNIFFSILPLIIVDIYALIKLKWGTQLFIILIETLVLSIIMAFVMLLEFCCIWNLSKRFDKVENGATLIVDNTDDNLLETKMREEALRGIMEAMDNHPDVFKEENELNWGTPNEKLLERANNPYVTDFG